MIQTMTDDFKLTKRTKTIIENFSRINPQMLFRPGQVIRTVSKDKDFFGVAKIEETIPTKFGINDLTRFLNVVNLYDSPALKVDDDKTLTILGDKNRKFAYTLTPEKIILTLPDNWNPPLPTPIASFDLSAADLQSIKKNIQVGELTEVVFTADGKNLYVKGTCVANPNSNEYSAKIGKTDADFHIIFVDRKFVNLMEYDYKVTIYHGLVNEKMLSIVKFASEALDYYLAPELGSKYE